VILIEVVEAEVSDIDITESEVLVSVGCGIEDEDNIEIAGGLAEAMGADDFCYRPIVDSNMAGKVPSGGNLRSDREPEHFVDRFPLI
jgi:electron transfer flavoprotein alpha subunit